MADPFGDNEEEFDGGVVPVLALDRPGPGEGLELRFSVEDMPKMDRFGKSDPQCVVFLLDHDDHWRLYDKTEWYKDKVSVTFEKAIVIPQSGGKYKDVKIEVYDLDKFKPEQINDLSNHDLIGRVQIPIDKLERKPEYSTPLYNPKLSGDGGTITIRSQAV